ncbi:S41 family peptidase [Microlunatus parietis]|uniref:Tricorn protease homolog n=1 Tax=Microlunatus parietis TaxID=682979 RepID=A0A7Y9LFE7_9ACTN|nr:S41 family peptidase [Microlunatus parietis]NYE74773.1 tricorn protease [Microlunatus parietis]
MTAGYFRFPDVNDDQLVFCAGDDLWLAPLAGGRAARLTADAAPVRHPRFSPDGRRVAWASARDGGWEVRLVDLESGAVQRLTYWGSDQTTVIGWRDDETVLVVSSAGEINLRHTTVRAVGVDGRSERLGFGPTSMLAVHESGAVALATRYSRPAEYWKRYRGGTASRLWLDPAGDGDWRRLLPDVEASLTSPLWYGDRLVFASDLEADLPGNPDGQANLYSVSAEGDDLTRHTQHTVRHGYVRDPASDGRTVVYHAHGALYRMSGLNTDPEPIELTLGTALAGRQPRALEPSEQLTQIRPDRAGNGSVLEWRGNAFYLTHREGPARALAADSGVRIREPRVLGDTGRAAYVTDADGEDAIEIRATDALTPPRRIAGGRLGRVLALEPDPAGARLAAVSHDGRVSLVDVESGEIRELGRSVNGEATGLAFSPDGRYLVWSEPNPTHRYLRLADLAAAPGTEPVQLTSGRFSDSSPSFTADGKYLAFLSARTFDPRYDSHTFDLGFASAVRPYLVPLAATTEAPFGPSADGWPVAPADPKAEGKEGSDAKGDDPAEPGAKDAGVGVKPTDEVAVDGFEHRMLPFPVPAGGYRELNATKAGVAWIREIDRGVLGSARADVPGDGPGDALEVYLLAERKLETLADPVDDYQVSGDGTRLVVRSGAEVKVVPAERPIKEDDDPAAVTVDLSRLRFELDPVAEWRQMFDEQGRLMRDHFWREDLDGVDWSAVLDRYRPIVDRLGSHDDLVDLLWETVGELNTSHAYVMPASRPDREEKRVGLLGADLAPADDGWEITAILPGETSDPEARSPLRAAGVGAEPGDRIVAVDGRPVDPRFGPTASLAGAAGQPVELTLRRPGGDQDRRVVVRPLESEEPIRYQAWVASRSAYVREATNGRFGYLHIPDMASPGWAQLHRDIDLATRAEGLIVDVRYNRGGHTSQLVIERLARRVIGWDVARQIRTAEEYPSQAPRGPVIFVTNEFAGSDGDIVSAAAQALRIGPVVGIRSWGGVVGIDGRFSLVDGTGVTQPRYAFWLEGYGWGVENHGIDPDVEVPITPAQWDGPADPQLDRAIEEAERLLAERPAAAPPQPEPPRAAR